MAGFQTHIATSTVLGIGYGVAARAFYDVPLDQCLLAAGLCSLSGMLPDLDSDNSVPMRESLAFGAAVVPMLLIDRFRNLGLSTDAIVLAAAIFYVIIRFGLGAILRSYTRHRGMFHSIPAAVIFAEVAYLMCGGEQTSYRWYKAGGVLVGFMSHLVLDEIWSVQWKLGMMHFKKSFGTALKLWDKVWWANVSTYAKLILLTYVVMNEPAWSGGRDTSQNPNSGVVNRPAPPAKPRTVETPPRVYR